MSEDSQSICARSDLLCGHTGWVFVDPSSVHEPEGHLLEIRCTASHLDLDLDLDLDLNLGW